MKMTLYVDARIGREQSVKTSNGTQRVRAIYEARWYNRVGYLQKGKKFWTAYTRTGEELGVYTHRTVALTELLQRSLAFPN